MFSPKVTAVRDGNHRLSMKQLKCDLNDFKSDLEEFKCSEPFKIYGFDAKKRETKKIINYLDMDIESCIDKPNPFVVKG